LARHGKTQRNERSFAAGDRNPGGGTDRHCDYQAGQKIRCSERLKPPLILSVCFYKVLSMNSNACPEFDLLHAVEIPRLIELVRDITDRGFLIAYSAH
jgi:hypothetical protein